jgi:hypothetical protein
MDRPDQDALGQRMRCIAEYAENIHDHHLGNQIITVSSLLSFSQRTHPPLRVLLLFFAAVQRENV